MLPPIAGTDLAQIEVGLIGLLYVFARHRLQVRYALLIVGNIAIGASTGGGDGCCGGCRPTK